MLYIYKYIIICNSVYSEFEVRVVYLATRSYSPVFTQPGAAS